MYQDLIRNDSVWQVRILPGDGNTSLFHRHVNASADSHGLAVGRQGEQPRRHGVRIPLLEFRFSLNKV